MTDPNKVGFIRISDEDDVTWYIQADCILAIKDEASITEVYFAVGNSQTMMIRSFVTAEVICEEMLCAMHKEV